MKIVRISVVTMAMVLGIFCGVSQSSAQSPSTPETMKAAKELVSLVSTSTISDLTANLTAQAWPTMETALRNQHANIDAATLAELRKEFELVMVSSINDAMSEGPAIYARYFTAQEMRDIMAFYQTPTGAKAMKIMPQATADLLAVLRPRIQGLQEKVNLAFLNILQKRGYYAR